MIKGCRLLCMTAAFCSVRGMGYERSFMSIWTINKGALLCSVLAEV